MRLLNMDVDRYGSYGRNRLGPFSPGLNAICGPRGAGKSTLLSWLRQIAAEDQLSRGHATGMAGTAEFEIRGLSYRVTADRNGRRRIDRHTDHSRHNYDGFAAERNDYRRAEERSWSLNLSDVQRQAFAGLVDARVAIDEEAALRELAGRLGLTEERSMGRKHLDDLHTRQAEIRNRLQRIEVRDLNRSQLLAEQQRLEDELEMVRSSGHILRYEGQDVERKRLHERSVAIEADLQSAVQEAARLQAEIERKQAELDRQDQNPTTVAIDESFRIQLQRIDDRLNRWRQTLRDLKSHRDSIDDSTTDARLDKQIGDQLSISKEADPRAALRSLEAQIAKTRRQLDDLVNRYTDVPGYDYRSASAAVSGTGFQAPDAPPAHGVFRDEAGRTYIGHPLHLPESSILPETLRSMQKDLHEVCQQLARHESQTATDTLRKQSSQLQRCETELLECIEELIEERAVLLRRIANEHHLSIEQLTLAFGNWCQCHDHPHLKEWLLSEEGSAATKKHGGDAATRQQLLDEIESLKRNRKDLTVRADECRRQLKDAETHRLSQVTQGVGPGKLGRARPEAEVQAELRTVLSDLATISDRDHLQAELQEIERQLSGDSASWRTDHFSEMTRQHIAGLMGTRLTNSTGVGQATVVERGGHHDRSRVYDLVDGVVTHGPRPSYMPSVSRQEVPRGVVLLAMRMAIADGLAARGEPISLWIDESLDTLPVEMQNSCIAYLAERARTGQQYVILTADQRVADCVRGHHGWSGILEQQIVRESPNVNQQLTALANEDEADRWQPAKASRSERRRVRNEFFLTESSLVEDLPSIDPDLAARCRSHGVDRIGDLLSVDPVWLAECLDVDGISESTVEAWQAVASLLCSVRNLRPFDARVLVGAGVRSPEQLSKMHPSQLLDRVERFLATERGRRILQSGTSYELSRITTWIASATNGTQRGYDWDARYAADARRAEGYDRRHGRWQPEQDGGMHSDDDRSYGRSSYSRRAHAYPVISRSGDRRHASHQTEGERSNRSTDYESRNEWKSKDREYEKNVETRSSQTEREDKLKFYLELASPIVDAPSIGPRMAERLEKHGYYTVDQLLAADADELADKLNLRRVDADVIIAWQDQARLVCRIPNLRGHDAQLLVACDLTSPEEIREMDAEDVHTQVSEVAASKLGQRILRGSNAPDLEEVQNWIAWAGRSRKLAA